MERSPGVCKDLPSWLIVGGTITVQVDNEILPTLTIALTLRSLSSAGVKQLIIGVNKMDTDTAGPYKEERYKEIADEMKHMLIRVGWKDTFLDKSVPILPISGWMGDNLIKKSDNMGWYKGKEVETLDGRKVHVSSTVPQ